MKRHLLGMVLAALLPILGFLAPVAISVAPTPAAAQSGCQYMTYGTTLTPAMWQSCWAAKQNYATGQVIGPSSATTGNVACWGTFPALTDCGAMPTVVAGAGITVTPSGHQYTVTATGAGTTYAANTVLGNFTGSTAAAAAFAVPSCSGAASALTFTTSSGLGCLTDNARTSQLQVFTASQRVTLQTPTISTATFTPNFDTGADFTIGLTAACPCTLANPSTTPVAGQHGVIYVVQDGTGSRTIGTWGTSYISGGGTSTITLSTAASAIDVISYAVKDSTHIVLSIGVLNATH